MKAAIIILSDPGSEEALGRAFNGMATAYDFKQSGNDASIYFQGAGSRWIKELGNADHPLHGLFEAVKESVVGVSCGCAEVFGAADDVKASGFDLISENKVPSTGGLPSLNKLVADGFTVLTF